MAGTVDCAPAAMARPVTRCVLMVSRGLLGRCSLPPSVLPVVLHEHSNQGDTWISKMGVDENLLR